nr:hypothetical protein [Ligilactobacillus salivarius]
MAYQKKRFGDGERGTKNLQNIAITAGGVVQFRAEDLDKFLESK